jgi:hypothetical protein
MSDGLEKGSLRLAFMHTPAVKEAFGPHRENMESIQHKLRTFLSEKEAQAVAILIYRVAVDIDEEIERVLKDPRVRKLYDYDGQFFTARFERLFHTAFNGHHLLKWLRESSLEPYFRGKDKGRAIEGLLEELRKHVGVARVRRMNWEDTQTLGMLPKDVLDAILKESQERMREANPPALSPEQQDFFQSFEEQMENGG